MFQTWYDSMAVILSQSFQEFSTFVPRIVAALIVLVVGAAVARAFKRLMVKVLETLRISSLVEKTPVEHFLKDADLGHKVEDVIGTVLYWLIMLVVVQTSVTILGLLSLSQILDKILGYIPHVISAILVLFFGVLLAGVVEGLVKGSIKSIHGKSARLLGKVSSYLVVTLTIMAAISELGIASEFIMILFVGLVTTLSLGLGLALGLGGKEVVAQILNSWYKQMLQDIAD